MKIKFMATCVSGAEDIVSEEILEICRDAKIVHKGKGRIWFNYINCMDDLMCLRCVDNIFLILSTFEIGPHKRDLMIFNHMIDKLNISNCNIIVSAAISGKHNYSRFDLAKEGEKILISKNCTIGTPENHDMAIRIDVQNGMCTILKQITSPQFRFRGKFNNVKGGIRPTVAHCLIRVSKPFNNEVFYDPFCGGGTIAMERYFYPCRKIFASDINVETLDTARLNLNNHIITFTCDATHTNIKKSSIDTVVTNLPWGKQIPFTDNLYDDFLKELDRILKPNGKAIILTDQTEYLYNACCKNRFSFLIRAELSLHGLHPKIFELKRNLVE